MRLKIYMTASNVAPLPKYYRKIRKLLKELLKINEH